MLNGDQMAELLDADKVSSANFRPDGSKIITASEEGTVRIWNHVESDFDRLLILGCAKLHNYLSTNPNATDSDRQMCGIPPRQK